ncbi:MAG TPA: MaoC family dehydratase [Solirubrobacteraceae bacterium]|nr:MaoC family dehydratase [Solirubrobacteraceae bacterium]
MVVLDGPDGVRRHAGQELGLSGWHEVLQSEIDTFADLTADHQWIHVDVERARASPFDGTIAHGFYTLALGPGLAAEIYTFEGFAFGLNYGLDRVRFPAPMPVGGRVRLRARLAAVDDLADGGIQVAITHTFEHEQGEKPVCVAEALGRFYP